jgi:hypothetical protein
LKAYNKVVVIPNNDYVLRLNIEKEVVNMKNLIIVMLVLMFTFGVAFASGGKNQGTTGQGTTSTGTTSQGAGTQSQTGK